MSELVPRRNALAPRREGRSVARSGGEGMHELLAFDVGEETYALPLDAVKEILKPPPVTEVPRAAAHVLGVISVRGRITTVIDLRRKLRRAMAPVDKASRVLLVEDEDEILGLLVDRVLQVYRLAPDEIETASVVSGETSEYVWGISRPRAARQTQKDRRDRAATHGADDILILLDHAELLRR